MRPTSTDLLPIGTALWSADRRHADAEQNPSHVGGLLVDQWANADGERSGCSTCAACEGWSSPCKRSRPPAVTRACT